MATQREIDLVCREYDIEDEQKTKQVLGLAEALADERDAHNDSVNTLQEKIDDLEAEKSEHVCEV